MIFKLVLGFLIQAVAVYLIALVVPGVRLRGFKTALGVSVIYSLLNFLLFKVFLFITFPLLILKVLTLGLFGVVINAVLLLITDRVMEDFELSGFGSALLAALGISVVSLVLGFVLL